MDRSDTIALLYGLGVAFIAAGVDLSLNLIGPGIVIVGVGLIVPAIWLTRS